MLLKLTTSDDLPLTLGERLPRDYEKKARVAEMEACAAALDIDLTVKWVSDERTCWGDFDHPAAEMPDPMAVVAAEFEKMCESFPISSLRQYAAGRVGGDLRQTAAVRCSFEDGKIHMEPIEERDLYAEVGLLEELAAAEREARRVSDDPASLDVSLFTRVGEGVYEWTNVVAQNSWRLTVPSDEEVRAYYKDRALGRGISDYSRKLFEKQLELRVRARTQPL